MSHLRPRVIAFGLATVAIVSLTCLAACSSSNDATSAGQGSGGDSSATTIVEAKPVPAQFAGHTSDIYSQPANWLCGPQAIKDHCTTDDIDATVIQADGSTAVEHRQVAANAPIDCFYVYPTVNNKPGGGNDLDLSNTGPELAATMAQAARFASVCNVYAPVYRQENLSAYFGPAEGQTAAAAVAYADVEDAFAYYMANFNDGRPIVLLGHSQGTHMLTKLLTDEFDNDADMRARLVSALLIGGDVKVPEGQDVGGTFQNLPLCRSTDQTGCVVTYNSYGTNPPPGGGTLFGHPRNGLVSACVNPAALGGGSGTLEPYLGKDRVTEVTANITTRLVSLPDAISAECVTEGGITFLGITAATQPGDVRDVTKAVTNQPAWGLHTSDVNLALGNLIDVVQAQVAALGL